MPRGQVRFKTARFHRPLFQQTDYQPIPFRPRANDSFSFPFLCHIAPPLSGHLFPVTVLPLSPLFSTMAPFPAFRCRCGMSLSAAPLIRTRWTPSLRNVPFCRTIDTNSLDAIDSPGPFHNGTVFRILLPLRNVPFCRTIDSGLLGSIASHDPFHNGTVFRILLPLWNVPFRRTIDLGLLGSIASHDPFVSRISLPLRNVPFCRTIDTNSLDAIDSPGPFHNGTVFRVSLPLRNILMELPLFHSFGRSSLSVHLPDSFQRSNGNENHPEHEKRTIPSSTRSKGVAFSRNPPTP